MEWYSISHSPPTEELSHMGPPTEELSRMAGGVGRGGVSEGQYWFMTRVGVRAKARVRERVRTRVEDEDEGSLWLSKMIENFQTL